MSLECGRHHHEAISLPGEVDGQQFHGAHAGETRLSDHVQVPREVFALGGAEHRARLAGDVFEPAPARADLLPRLVVTRPRKDDVMHRVPTQLEGGAQLLNLGRRHGSPLGLHRDVESPSQVIPSEQLGHAEVQRMAIIPTRFYIRAFLHNWMASAGVRNSGIPDLRAVVAVALRPASALVGRSRAVMVWSANGGRVQRRADGFRPFGNPSWVPFE